MLVGKVVKGVFVEVLLLWTDTWGLWNYWVACWIVMGQLISIPVIEEFTSD
jgi:hypothetical protein